MNTLERCFEGTLEQPPRLIKRKPDVESAESHLVKAEMNLAATDLLQKNKFFDWAIITAYYAMYHGVMAALWLKGLEARSHECAIEAFEAFYINSGNASKEYSEYVETAHKLNAKYAETLEQAKTERVKASYGTGEIKSYEAEQVVNNAYEFIDEIKKLVYAAKGIDHFKVR